MTLELNLRFPEPIQVVVRFDGDDTATLPFANPLKPKDHQDLRWYVETYGSHSLDDPDDAEAARIRQLLPVWGKKLFDAVFHERAAQRLFNRFQDAEGETRLITLSAEHPEILSLPWELLHDSSAPDGTHLFRETISIRRSYAGAGGGRKPFTIKTKHRLHLLFVVSRPDDAGFIDPRGDAAAVLDAIDTHAPERISVEFLRPATLDALVARLDDDSKPSVDILHFDGHGVFDREGHILQQRKSASGADSLLKDSTAKAAPNTGYLLFEDGEYQSALVSARQLGENLHRRKVALVILSACQSAMQGEDEPLGCVAVRLTETGIPAVLAMTHSVLVTTAQTLFGQFYQHLAQGLGLGEALDRVRRHLDNHPEKYEVQRGSERVWLRLHDWFIPALYQSGDDTPLLSRGTPAVASTGDNAVDPNPSPKGTGGLDSTAWVSGHLPERPEAGFFGRRRELLEIERGFAGTARRISLIGFGGQGKTALAQEAGRWLVRTGLFDTACFVNYAEAPGRDALAVAVAALSCVLGESLPDAAATTAALRRNACLLILDNLEILAAETLAELLDQAKHWSEAGGSRVLLTSRRPDFNHVAYQSTGTLVHRQIRLTGLGDRNRPDDALDWFARLWKFPPAAVQPKPQRQALIDLFEQVAFHPLSLRVVTAQLKTRRIAELGGRLNHWLAQPAAWSIAQEDHPAALVASLQLSLERLEPSARALLPSLGVFQGGAMEPDLLAITQIPEETWPSLRQQLQTAALIEVEYVPGVNPPFLRFHPTLAPLLWLELDDSAKSELGVAHRAGYCALADFLWGEDDGNPYFACALARCELPNLLQAVRSALQSAEPEAVTFADRVNRFLNYFGLRREQAELARLAKPLALETGSEAWYRVQFSRGDQLIAEGHAGEAAQVFQSLLSALGETNSDWRAMFLSRLGRCFRAAGRPEQAVAMQQQALTLLLRLEPSDGVKRQAASYLTDMADALSDLGQYPQAREAYLAALAIAQALNDTRSQGVVLTQLGTLGTLGTLALHEHQYPEAIVLPASLGPVPELAGTRQCSHRRASTGRCLSANRAMGRG